MTYAGFVLNVPQAAKDVVLAEKPVITDDSNQLDPSLLDELLSNIATLSSVYHKPPDAFVTRMKTTTQRSEDDEYPDGNEGGYAESVLELLGDLIGLDNSAIVPVGQPSETAG